MHITSSCTLQIFQFRNLKKLYNHFVFYFSGVDIVPQREKRNNPLENWDPLKNDDDLADNEVSDKILPENDEEREEDEG